jgi:hypothetical protein
VAPDRLLTAGLARIAAALCAALLLAAPALAQPVRPLLVEGTRTVFQRVLTRPGAPLHAAPSGAETRRYPAFQPLYVFAREDDWIEVGPSVTGAPAGWVRAGDVVDWKQNIVGAFTNPAGRERQLLFDTEADLRALLNDEDARARAARLIGEAEANQGGAEGVVAIEPADYVNIRDDLYLMPILGFVEDNHPLNYEELLLMRVASVPKREESAPAPDAEAPDPADFNVGIVFVLDTTKSMDPYIARTNRVMERTVERLRGTEVGEQVNFGLIGFRDDPEAAPGVEYRTRTLLPLERRGDQTPVLQALAATTTAGVSTVGFNEDSLAGVEDAIDGIDWDQSQAGGPPVSARYVILVTDAGPKDPRDPDARSQIGAAELQRDAEGKNIVVITLHLRTPAGGEANHEFAEAQYRKLSRFAGRDFYFPIEGGSEDVFEAATDRLVTAITDHVRMIRGEAPALPEAAPDDPMAELGRAMQLAWLGAQRGTEPPAVIEGWLTDKAEVAPDRLAVEPRLLLTKNELATMAELLNKLTTLADQGDQDPYAFFDQVRGVLAQMATDPNRVVDAESDTLGGALEYLEFLPYRSQLLQMTADRWGQSAMVRREIIDGMRQKLTQYRKWLYDPAVWTPLEEGAPDGEWVFAMPFDVLP